MFSKRMYANLEIRRAGAKGFGLFALEDIKAGQFIIEYIGEVLEEDEYQRRKEYYMSVGQRHYYFMNIGNGEVIDACRKGNISRFINHSCEPNCETQKWLVHGELAIGLFAVRDIPKDTELTFDYNFERYGDKPMRCYCKSGGCRKFIGGTQDNFDVSLLPAVETVEDATHDWPPIMLGETDMDPNMRMLLDWRVGTRVDRPKEMGMVTRLERLCKARNVNWTVDYFYNPTFVPVQKQSAQPLILPPELPTAQAVTGKGAGAAQQQTSGGSGKAEKDKPGADSTPAPSTAKSKQQRKAEKAAATATAGKGKASAAKQDKQDKQRAEGGAAAVSKLQLEDGAAAGPGPGSLAQAMAGTPQFRGPKALFKQWKIMQQQDATPAPAVEEKPAAAPSSPPSPRSPRSQSPSPSQRSGGADAEAGLEDEDAEVEVRAAAAAAAKHAPLRKRLKRLPVKKPPPPAPVPEAPQQQNGSAAKASARKQSMDRSASPARSSSPPPAGAGRPLDRPNATGGTSRRGLRSEIDRRLDEVVGATGRLKDPSRQNIIKVLRLFNLCDMGHPNRTFGAAAGGRYLNGGRMGFGDDGGPGASSAGMTARQRARMADLSLLLDVVLKTTSSAAKKDFVTCGLLTQLHQAMGRNTGKEYCVILRKVLRVVEALPLEANDVYSVRSAHGNFADMLRQLSTNADYDVRTKAAALLKKFPPSAVTDQRLLQLMAAPPVRFGGMGRPGMGGMGMGGMGRFPSMMQQQMMQQQMMQQQMLKQQQMMRMKEAQAAAAAAAAAANAGGLPPPPPLGGGAAGSASGEGGAGGGGSADPALARTSSTASFGEGDPSELDGMGGGPMGLPPLGPGAARQRMMAAAAAMGGGRPGMMRNMGPGRQGMGPMGMGPGMGMMGNGMGPGGRPGMGMMGMGPMGMGPSPLGLPPRPPSPASAEAYAGYGSGAGGDDASGSAAKRRKYSHTGLDGADASSFGGPLPGPPPRHPYMGGQQGYGLHHGYPGSYYGRDGMDMDREPPGPPPLPPDLPLPPPPPLLGGLYGRSSSEERDLLGLGLADLPERLGVEQVFALARPRPRPPLLPPLQGTLQPERHLHGQLTDIVALFALGLYGSGNSAWGPRPGAAGAAASGAVAAAEGQEEKGKERAKEGATGSREKDTGAAAANGGDKEKSKGDEGAASAAGGGGEEGEAAATVAAVDQGDAASSLSDMTACCCWSPLVAVDGADVAMSPLVETAAAGTNEALPPPPPLPLPPGVSGNANGPPLGEGGVPLRPLRTTSTMGVAAAAGPSPYHTNSPAAYGGRDGPAPAGLPTGTNSTNSTPTVAGFGGAGGLGGPAAATATAAAAGGSALPPVVPISSLSDWRMPGGAADAAGAAAAGGATPAVARASPHASPEHQGAAAGGAAGQEENIDEWLRPVSTSHLEVWEEPDSSFEAYVADMVRHRLGKYMQPEHPSRVSVQEATALRAKVYREVVAKERRAWEERRSAGVFKPIERHKLESNLKEFVRSTIKRMRDREKEKGGVPAPAAATPVLHGGQHHSHGSHRHGGGHGGAAAGQGANPPTQVTSPSAPAVTPAAAKPVAAALPPAAPAAGQAPSASLPPRPSAPLVPEATEAAIATAEAPTPATAHPVVAAAEPAAQPAEQSNGGDVVAPGDHVMGEVEEEPLTPPEEETRAEAAAVRDVVMAVGS